jgi:hypothetical protein
MHYIEQAITMKLSKNIHANISFQIKQINTRSIDILKLQIQNPINKQLQSIENKNVEKKTLRTNQQKKKKKIKSKPESRIQNPENRTNAKNPKQLFK